MKKMLTFLFLFSTVASWAQSVNDLDRINNQVKIQESGYIVKKEPKTLQTTLNPIKALSFLSLYFYQAFLSEQISASCEFDISCSNYSLLAIKEFGLLKGLFLTADRLTRCDGRAQTEMENYLINHLTGKAIDEPSMYRFKN